MTTIGTTNAPRSVTTIDLAEHEMEFIKAASVSRATIAECISIMRLSQHAALHPDECERSFIYDLCERLEKAIGELERVK